MSTVFVALQCYQCSTMQVKQRKKSSNKWSCVICNEKQSVRKVFSQASMAKDVRNFVQNFNMSRQFAEQQQELRDDEEETLGYEEIEIQPNSKRTDWSEYIDPDVNEFGIGDDEGDLCEPNVVTELPKPLFKKPKLRDNYSAAGLDSEDGEKLRRPGFGKRTDKKKFNSPVKVPTTVMKENFKTIGETENQANYGNVNNSSMNERSSSIMTKIRRPMSKLNNNGGNVDHSFAYTGSSSVMMKMKRPASKWQDYIDVDDDDADGLQLESRCREVNHSAFETTVSDDIVEDDVHPDFM